MTIYVNVLVFKLSCLSFLPFSKKKNGTSYRSLANIQWHLKQFLSVFSFSYLNLLFLKNVLKGEEGAVNCWVSVIGLCVNKGVLIPQILITK